MKDPKEKREELKNQAVLLREQEKYQEALEIFDEILKWDELNDNPRGKMDVLGHKRLALSEIAEKSTDTNEKKRLLTKATKCIEDALALEGTHPRINEGVIQTQKIHLASALLKESTVSESQAAGQLRKLALETIEEVLDNYLGDVAAKAWPLGIKADICLAQQKINAAIDSLLEAQKVLFEGYRVAVKEADQIELKYKVWLSGTFARLSNIANNENMPLISEIYSGAILGIPDPDNILKSKKSQAEENLKNLEGKNEGTMD